MKHAQEHQIASALASIDKSLVRIAESAEALVSLAFTVGQVYIAERAAAQGIRGEEKPEDLVLSAEEQVKRHIEAQRARMSNG